MNIKYLIPFYKNYVRAMSRLSAIESAFDYVLRYPEYIDENNLAFNGQHHRQLIFCEIEKAFELGAVYETGTYMGNTTGYIRKRVKCSVHTCEASHMFQAVAMSRLRKFDGIDFFLGDSRKFLSKKIESNSKDQNGIKFFYLDAHWHNDLPLEEEIQIIAEKSGPCVIMIDDFCVPGDMDYGYDDYGKGKCLDLQTFKKSFLRAKMDVFFPSLSGREETGGKRGCVVLGHGDGVLETLEGITSLKKFLV
jgi:hypothetical protein